MSETVAKTVVVYSSDPAARNNKLFDRSSHGFNRYVWYWNYLYEECKKRGITMVTSDVYLKDAKRPPAVLLVASLNIDAETKKELLHSSLLHPKIFAFSEGPMYACFLYWNLRVFSRQFDHVFMPRAAAVRVSPEAAFHTQIDALPYDRGMTVPGGFGSRKYLALVNSNTRLNPWKSFFARCAQVIYPLPTFIARELYIDRLEAIRFFAQRDDFDLYGHRWNDRVPYASRRMDARYRGAIKKAYRGTPDDKMTVLKNYKFAICFENTIYGGYISEKMFDAMFSGCIPVYWGAPDIADFVPEGTFIDFRRFKDFEALDEHLFSMDEATYEEYIKNIRNFLRSPQYDALSQEHFAKTIIPIFES